MIYKKWLVIGFFLCNIFSKQMLHTMNFGDAVGNLKNTFSGGALLGMAEGLGQSVGVVEGYNYKFRVFNDSPAPIAVAVQRITPVLGAKFSGEVKDQFKPYLAPFENTGSYFYNQNLYLDVFLLYSGDKKNAYANYGKERIQNLAEWGTFVPGLGNAIGALIGAIETTKKLESNSILHRSVSLGVKDDKNVYYYRAYTDKGELKGEYLGIGTTTKDFVGVFYNNTILTDISLKFMKDGATYTASLEPGTFSLLSSTSGVTNSIRPPEGQEWAFVFYKGTNVLASVPVQKEGIASMQLDPKSPKDKPQLIAGASYVYTYEIYKDPKTGSPVLGLQGLNVGNHDQTIDPKNSSKEVVRDINPLDCRIWLQSADQFNTLVAKQDKTALPTGFDAPGQIWCAYKTKDSTVQQKLSIGAVTTVKMLRPLISEKSAMLYCVWLDTTDDAQAKKFLDRLLTGQLGKDATQVPKEDFDVTQIDKTTLLIKPQPNKHGIIDDVKNSGVKGMILLADIFLPQGVGSGPFYYTLSPALIDLETLINPVQPFLDSKKYAPGAQDDEAVYRALNKDVLSWVLAYQKNPTVATQTITQYIQQKSYDSVSKDSKLLKQITDAILTGPVGLSHLPLIRQAGLNNYVYALDQQPEGWPTKAS